MSLLLASAGSGVLRDAHYVLNPVSGLYERATLLERAATNALTFSEQIDNVAYTKSECTITANAATAPDGAATGDKVVESATATTHHYVQRATLPALTSNATQAWSFFAKAAERSWLRVQTFDKAGLFRISWVNLSTGAVGTNDAGHTITLTAMPNGWYRIIVLYNAGTGATAPSLTISLATGDGVTTYTGDGVSGAYLWGWQFEVDVSSASSYIATGAATASRAADALSFPFTLAPQEMTFYLRFVERGGNVLLNIGKTDFSRPRLLIYAGSTGYRIQHDRSATSAPQSVAAAYPTAGQLCELRGVLYADGSVQIGQSVNGGAETIAARSSAAPLASAWSDSVISFGSIGGSSGGVLPLLAWKAAKGTQTMADMRVLA
ncbi:MAG: hypothetical protein HOQ34_02570 [Gemmatimonadaceae bacterium]|nr:hypothetical protein [Gemmatimonadaceae bacterium]